MSSSREVVPGGSLLGKQLTDGSANPFLTARHRWNHPSGGSSGPSVQRRPGRRLRPQHLPPCARAREDQFVPLVFGDLRKLAEMPQRHGDVGGRCRFARVFGQLT